MASTHRLGQGCRRKKRREKIEKLTKATIQSTGNASCWKHDNHPPPALQLSSPSTMQPHSPTCLPRLKLKLKPKLKRPKALPPSR